MVESEVKVELLPKNLQSGKKGCRGEGPQKDLSGPHEPLLLLADVSLAPSCGDETTCSCDCETCRCLEVRDMEKGLQILQLQLLCFMSKADDLHKCLDKEKNLGESQALAAKVPSFLFTCQPFFNHLQATAWNSLSQKTGLPLDIYTRLLDLSQQLCDKLEQLVLTYARHGLLCLDETEPNSVSHFCIGQSQIGHLRVTVFRYCRPTPYLAKVNTGLYKRMRWNVERLQEQQHQQADGEPAGRRQQCAAHTVGETEYYFLCCEDIPNTPADGNSHVVCSINMARMWTIGQWVQVKPDPNSEDIYDWITCEAPQANYHRLLLLGSEEPTCCRATDLLQELLLSNQSTQ